MACSADDAGCVIDEEEERQLDNCIFCQRQYHVGGECHAMKVGRDKRNFLSKVCSDCHKEWTEWEGAQQRIAAEAAAAAAAAASE